MYLTEVYNPVILFRRRMQRYVANLYNIMQRYVIRGDISPHFRRLIAVSDRFCGDNLIDI